MFSLFKRFRRDVRPILQIDEYYTPVRNPGAAPAAMTALEQMYAYYRAC